MSSLQRAHASGPVAPGVGRVISQRPCAHLRAIPGWQDDIQVAALRLAYKGAGGLGRGDEIGRLMADHFPATFISMAQLVADEEVFGFEWDRSLWPPMFQFGLLDLSIRAAPRLVRAELGEGFDGWALSTWFIEPNLWLASCRPIDLLECQLQAVLQAAHADRFVATG